MKPMLSSTDYDTLRELVKYSAVPNQAKEIKQLTQELNRAIVLDNDKLDTGVVKLNSIVEVLHVERGKKMTLKIVLPAAANVHENKISILAPMGIALIGFKETDTIQWEMPSGIAHLKIIRVNNDEAGIPEP